MQRSVIANEALEKLEAKDSKVGGKTFDMWSLRKEVILYGTSLEGDEYSSAPLFFTSGDAVLHALNPMFIKDTIGISTPDYPANTQYSKTLRFNSGLRIRVYILDSQAFYYDARNKARLDCIEVGSSNFKINYHLRLPTGIDTPGSKTKPQTEDKILQNIVNNNELYPNDTSLNQAVRIEAFHFCAPGKLLKIQKSFRIDMAKLWMFYANLLTKGYDPNGIRTAAFLGDENSKAVINGMISDMQTPTAIGAIPKSITAGIEANESLEQLLKRCAASTITQKVCVSGPFFKLLWQRDVESADKYFVFDAKDNDKFIPLKVKTAMTAGWMYLEDFNPDIGYADIAYNINYNRFLDVNSTVCWVIRNLKRSKRLISNKNYNVEQHEKLIRYRFSDNDLDRFVRIVVYDGDGDLKIEMAFNLATAEFNLNIRNISGSERAKNQLGVVQQFLEVLLNKSLVKFKVKNNKFEHKVENTIALFPANENSKENIPSNWYLLLLISSFLRYLIKKEDFNFFSFF